MFSVFPFKLNREMKRLHLHVSVQGRGPELRAGVGEGTLHILHIYSPVPLALVLSRSLTNKPSLALSNVVVTLLIFETIKSVLHISPVADFRPGVFDLLCV